jgi:hypothetical protein
MSCDPQTRQDAPTSRNAGRSASASTRSLTAPEVVVAWLRVGEPIPDGWRVAAQRATHHHRHAFLIEQVTP